MSDPTLVSASIIVEDVSPAEVFAWLTDTSNHVTNDGSGHVVGPVGPTTLTAKGDRFGMRMRWIVPYTITNTVVEFDRDRRIAWRHMAGHRWRYELEAVEGGTKVTESFDLGPVPSVARPIYAVAFGFPKAYVDNLERSLARLRAALVPTAA